MNNQPNSTSEIKPLPCPFCGGEVVVSNLKDKIITANKYFCYCKKCYSDRDGVYSTRLKAIKYWNHRAPLQEDRQVEEDFEKWYEENHAYFAAQIYSSEHKAKKVWDHQQKQIEALQERVREMNLKMDVAQKLIEEYSSLYPTAYRYGRIKTYTQLFEQKLSQPEQKKSSMSSEAKQEK